MQCKWSDLGDNITAPKAYEVPHVGVILVLPADVARATQLGGDPTILLRENMGATASKDTMKNYIVHDIVRG